MFTFCKNFKSNVVLHLIDELRKRSVYDIFFNIVITKCIEGYWELVYSIHWDRITYIQSTSFEWTTLYYIRSITTKLFLFVFVWFICMYMCYNFWVERYKHVLKSMLQQSAMRLQLLLLHLCRLLSDIHTCFADGKPTNCSRSDFHNWLSLKSLCI